jgi:hypothetical protein
VREYRKLGKDKKKTKNDFSIIHLEARATVINIDEVVVVRRTQKKYSCNAINIEMAPGEGFEPSRPVRATGSLRITQGLRSFLRLLTLIDLRLIRSAIPANWGLRVPRYKTVYSGSTIKLHYSGAIEIFLDRNALIENPGLLQHLQGIVVLFLVFEYLIKHLLL